MLMRSDVLFSIREAYKGNWQDVFKAFYANRVVWTYIPGRLLQDNPTVPVQAGTFQWVTPDMPGWQAMACDPVPKTTLHHPKIATSAYRSLVLTKFKQYVDLGVTHFQQDGATNYGASCATKASRIAYYGWLFGELRKHAAGRNLYFSCNAQVVNGAVPEWLHGIFDFLMVEGVQTFVTQSEAPPNLLLRYAQGMRAFRGSSIVHAITHEVQGINLHRMLIASSYALGLVPIAPWDLFQGFNKPRFYGNPGHYADLYGMVRANPLLFDNFMPLHETYDIYDARVRPSARQYLAAVTKRTVDSTQRLVHLVNWGTPTASLRVRLLASEFPRPPVHLVSPERSVAVPINYTVQSGDLVYNVGRVDRWAILY